MHVWCGVFWGQYKEKVAPLSSKQVVIIVFHMESSKGTKTLSTSLLKWLNERKQHSSVKYAESSRGTVMPGLWLCPAKGRINSLFGQSLEEVSGFLTKPHFIPSWEAGG